MVSKTIKISEENYKWLLALATEIQKKKGEKVTFDDALNDLAEKKERKKLSDLAGKWKMSDSEWNKIRDELNKGWRKWKIRSV